jgi:YegS/Rv2252/BmrU family lipid kinase
LKKVLFIVNSRAGTGRREGFPRQVEEVLDPGLFSWEIVYTSYRGHAASLSAQAAREGVDAVAAVGGDGSVNEVARGLLGTGCALAVIPAGSGNGFARMLGIPRNIPGALQAINDFHPVTIDVGFANGHLFLSNAGAGFDSLIARLFHDAPNRGLFNYARLVLGAIRTYRCKHYHLVMDSGELRERAFFVVAANGDQFGYNFRIAPGARMNDGLLDICVLKPIRWWQLPTVSLMSLTGRLGNSRFAIHMRCRSLVLERDEELSWMQVDGDPVDVREGRVEISVAPGALRVLAPSVPPR